MFVGAALGAAATTLPAGHRGRNVPVKELESGKVYITHQHRGGAARGAGAIRTSKSPTCTPATGASRG